jgi:hypothetical protein
MLLSTAQKGDYLKYIILYKQGNRLTTGSTDYNKALVIEQDPLQWAKKTRLSNGLDIPSITYNEPTGSAPKGGAEGELFFTPSDPLTTTVGLPPGTTPTGTTPTGTTTTPGTTENFLSKYKMPLIIGAVAIGYFLLKKKK